MRYGRNAGAEDAADALLREAGYGTDGRTAEDRAPEVLADDLVDLTRAAFGTTDTNGVERVASPDDWGPLEWAERHADAGAPVMRSSWLQPTHGRARYGWRTADTFVHSDGRILAVASPILFVRRPGDARWIMAAQTPTDVRGRRALWGRKRIHESEAARKRNERAGESPEAAQARRAANAERMRQRRAAARAAAIVDAPAQ
jgi:hypothetical protein